MSPAAPIFLKILCPKFAPPPRYVDQPVAPLQREKEVLKNNSFIKGFHQGFIKIVFFLVRSFIFTIVVHLCSDIRKKIYFGHSFLLKKKHCCELTHKAQNIQNMEGKMNVLNLISGFQRFLEIFLFYLIAKRNSPISIFISQNFALYLFSITRNGEITCMVQHNLTW